MSHAYKTLKHSLLKPNASHERKGTASSSRQRTFNSLLLLTILLTSVGYLVQVNALSTKGYAIKDLEKKIAFQQKENERLHMQIIEAQSLGSLQTRIDALQLVRTERIDYISSTAHTLATAR